MSSFTTRVWCMALLQIALRRLGFDFVSRDEEEALMDALDPGGSGGVAYEDFVEFFRGANSWPKTDADLIERYAFQIYFLFARKTGACQRFARLGVCLVCEE